MIRSLLTVTISILFCAGYTCAGDIIVNGNGNAINGSTVSEGASFPPILSYEEFLKLSTSIQPDRLARNEHSSYRELYRQAINFAREENYNAALAICNNIIRTGDRTYRSKCAKLKEQISSR